MASSTILNDIENCSNERELTAEEGWELLFASFGKSKELFASFGGGEAFLKAERAAWGEDQAG